MEETIPTKSIYINEAQGEEHQATPLTNMDVNVIKQTLALMYKNELIIGKNQEQAKAYLKTIEPFNNYEELIDNL